MTISKSPMSTIKGQVFERNASQHISNAWCGIPGEISATKSISLKSWNTLYKNSHSNKSVKMLSSNEWLWGHHKVEDVLKILRSF